MIVPSSASNEPLHLGYFFNVDTDEWKEARYDVAAKSQLMGIGGTITSCGDSNPRKLEMRVAHRFSELTFSAGQSQTSESTQNKVVVEVLTNNEKVESHSIPFDKLQDFKIDVKDMSSVAIQAYLDDNAENCYANGASTIVLTDVRLK